MAGTFFAALTAKMGADAVVLTAIFAEATLEGIGTHAKTAAEALAQDAVTDTGTVFVARPLMVTWGVSLERLPNGALTGSISHHLELGLQLYFVL